MLFINYLFLVIGDIHKGWVELKKGINCPVDPFYVMSFQWGQEFK